MNVNLVNIRFSTLYRVVTNDPRAVGLRGVLREWFQYPLSGRDQ